MNIQEMIAKNPKRSCHPPESIFLVRDPERGVVPMCFASFVFDRETMLANHPELASMEVVQEHLTKEEVDALKAPNVAVSEKAAPGGTP